MAIGHRKGPISNKCRSYMKKNIFKLNCRKQVLSFFLKSINIYSKLCSSLSFFNKKGKCQTKYFINCSFVFYCLFLYILGNQINLPFCMSLEGAFSFLSIITDTSNINIAAYFAAIRAIFYFPFCSFQLLTLYWSYVESKLLLEVEFFRWLGCWKSGNGSSSD